MKNSVSTQLDSPIFYHKIVFVLCMYLLIVLIFLAATMNTTNLHHINRLTEVTNLTHQNSQTFTTNNLMTLSVPPAFRLLMGILTIPENYEQRRLLRLVYGVQRPITTAVVDIKFVVCNLTTEDQKIFVGLEIMMYNDIMILNCTENMDDGKTYSYFSSLAGIFNDENNTSPPYDYVMKTDDDTYFRLEKLVKSLTPLPRYELYYGALIPCQSKDPFHRYMSGMGYILSWDLVEWIRTSEIPKNHTTGPEDLVVSEWLNAGERAKFRYNTRPNMYDYPDPPHECFKELLPETIALHRMKGTERWVKSLNYFNVTNGLRSSTMYHIP